MDALTEHEMEGIVQRLETLVTALEHDRASSRVTRSSWSRRVCGDEGKPGTRWRISAGASCLAHRHAADPGRTGLRSRALDPLA